MNTPENNHAAPAHDAPLTVEKLPTGIKGLDEMLGGGIPKGRCTLVTGFAGTGKTVLLNEFLYRGIQHYNENGVFVTLGETKDDIVQNVGAFNWDYPGLVSQGSLRFLDLTPKPDETIEHIDSGYDFTPMVVRIQNALGKAGASRLVIDGLDALFQRFSDKDAIRMSLFQLSARLKALGVTTMISAEKSRGKDVLSRYGIAEFVTDTILDLEMDEGEMKFTRRIYVRKMRGAGFRSGRVHYEISSRGMEVLPRIPIDLSMARTDLSIRKKTGISALDDAMEGGIPEGHVILVSGNTGTGKSILGLHFLEAGLKVGEKSLFVALEEPPDQVRKAAYGFGWDFEAYEKSGRLRIITAPLIDLLPDQLLHTIFDALKANGVKRIVVDSISTILSESMSQEGVRRFLIQLYGLAKTHGVTCMLSYLAASNFDAQQGQLLGSLTTSDLRLSSVVDGIILFRYVERDQEVKRVINILKMRGSNHSKSLFAYEVGAYGIQLGAPFSK
ncbi:MAG: ATPase domain-containing protein [Deltaproteobacteria bacterium]|nr:ATPase domain-containing protein [Deltaproteobacteria bacterium]